MRSNHLKFDATDIFLTAVKSSLPDFAVHRALEKWHLPDKIIIVAIGKAAWRMARAAASSLNGKTLSGAIITKYGHSDGPVGSLKIFEAGHPVSDANTIIATEHVLNITKGLNKDDCILFLVSGGGSALFESPLPGLTINDIVHLNYQLLESGANINEVNTIRKRVSKVKGGRFAIHCKPAHIYQIILSDVVGDDLSSIASGPAAIDSSSASDVNGLIKRYGLIIPEPMRSVLNNELPTMLKNVSTIVAGSVRGLCTSAFERAEELGYNSYLLTDSLCGEARNASELIANEIGKIRDAKSGYILPCALIMGGETTVTIKGDGKGGRNQELALYAAKLISGLQNAVILSAGSDGTDGPTDVAGGIVDGDTWCTLERFGMDPQSMLDNNNSYYALKSCDGLVITGPTGTNVNDLTIALCM